MIGPATAPGAEGAPGTGEAAGEAWTAPLRSTFAFLAAPAAVAFAVLVLGIPLSGWVLYGVAGVVGLVLLGRMFRDPEWLLAVFVLYVPVMKLFVVPVAPGVNGTNALLGLLLLAWWGPALLGTRPFFNGMTPARLVGAWCAVSLLSVLTAAFTFGPAFVLDAIDDVKRWLEGFLIFFAFLHLLRDGAMARRVVVYMMLGSLVALGLGGQEWLDKRLMDTIEKARLLGPQLQPNDFGAFLVYGAAPFLGVFLTQLPRIRAWLAVPYFLLLARILLATFSRGAFIGMAAAGVAAAWVRGRLFLVAMAILAAGLLAWMPELVPESLQARMGSTATMEGGEELDASSQTRLVLWKAAVAMTLESPVLGKGFKAFPLLKANYTEVDVHESDNHNMFLYVASQMGIPALLVFLGLLWRTYRLGTAVHRAGGDPFRRAIGMGGAALAVGVVGVNLFGSRMTDIAVDAYFWIYLAVLAHLWREIAPPPPDAPPPLAPGA